jgi:hypothetical protein
MQVTETALGATGHAAHPFAGQAKSNSHDGSKQRVCVAMALTGGIVSGLAHGLPSSPGSDPASQAAEKVIYFVIPNEVRNLSLV